MRVIKPVVERDLRKPVWILLVLLLLFLLGGGRGFAAGPRWVTGWPFFTGGSGAAVVWSNKAPLYFTDPGALSVYVSHEAADALVAAAASVWNVPVANLTIGQGGVLAEHVSSANVYLGTSGMMYPADVASTNHAAVPIAVIYDGDGSVTDTLLGGGASDPSSCRQNGVTESVDLFDPAGYILHAVLIVNGRCTGPEAEQQLQLQYQLMRAFGRVLGLAWSQTNDNVFTGTPTPTLQQAQNWPIMHPIDIVCGSYTYQCLPAPFTLRPDDIASLATLYPVTQNPPPAGKQVTLVQAAQAHGKLLFPTGEGMGGVNVTFQRINSNTTVAEGWEESSAVTGTYFRREQATPVNAQGTAVNDSAGSFTRDFQGYYGIGYLPIVAGTTYDTLITSTEAVNPLYTGSYAVGPYVAGTVTPSGSAMTRNVGGAPVNSDDGLTLVVPDAASTCSSDSDGTVSAPVAADASGWWNGLLCAYGHTAWTTLPVQAGRSVTFEVTALDELGYATENKARPVMGAWAWTDSTASLPTLGSVSAPFNGAAVGLSTMTVSVAQATTLRLVVTDQRGDGRPDFGYQTRTFYADTIAPASVAPAGGNVTISGMGFRAGNVVRIHGVLATGVSASSNSLVVTVPTMALAGATDGMAVDVVVSDLSTGATSTMTGALTYSSAGSSTNVMKVMTTPAGTAFVGNPASGPFAVQVMKSDGVTPVVGDTVTFSGSVAGVASAVTLGACGGPTCVVMTNANGVASTTVTPTSAGAASVKAVDGMLNASVSFTAITKAGAMQMVSAPTGSVTVGSSAATAFAVKLVAADGTTALAGRTVTFSTTAGSATFDACVAATCVVTTNSTGVASTGVTPTATGAVGVQASDGLLSQTAGFTATPNTPVLKLIGPPPTSAYIQTRTTNGFTVGLYKADGVTPMTLQPVTFSVVSATDGASGLTFSLCNTAPCTALTNSQGTIGGPIDVGTMPGTYTLQAAYGTLVQTIVINVLARTPILKIVSIPTGNQIVGKVSPMPFTVQLTTYDGLTPLSGWQLSLAGVANMVKFGPCGYPSCVILTDSNGYATGTVTPLAIGPITLEAVMDNQIVTGQITGVSSTDTVQVVSAPSGTINSGSVAATPFAVQVIGAGQTAPTAGKAIKFSVTGGAGTFGVCSLATCTVTTDGNGMASTTVTPTSVGTVTLQAADGQVTQAVSFTAKSTQNLLQLVSAPNGSVFVGDVPAVPFAVRVVQSDGVTPVSGVGVTVSIASGGATGTLLACRASSCTLTTDATGTVSTAVQPLTAGVVTLRGSVTGLSPAGATFLATLTGVTPTETLTAKVPTIYVAESRVMPWTMTAAAVYDGAAAAGVAVNWTGATGLSVAETQTTTDAFGNTSVPATVGPLAGGATATASACAWTTVCAKFQAVGVAASTWQVVFVSGAAQPVQGGASLQPVVVQVVDGAGHGVVGAALSVMQTVREAVTCPARGRCPAAPTMAAKTMQGVTDASGQFTFTVLTVADMATETSIAVSAGTQGFASAVVQSTP